MIKCHSLVFHGFVVLMPAISADTQALCVQTCTVAINLDMLHQFLHVLPSLLDTVALEPGTQCVAVILVLLPIWISVRPLLGPFWRFVEQGVRNLRSGDVPS